MHANYKDPAVVIALFLAHLKDGGEEVLLCEEFVLLMVAGITLPKWIECSAMDWNSTIPGFVLKLSDL